MGTGEECGAPCSEGVCDENGVCTSPEHNSCIVHGCSEKKCGDACLSGDISGVCDAEGKCNFDVDSVTLGGQCGAQSRDSEATTTFESLKPVNTIQKSDLELNAPLEKPKSSLGLERSDSVATTSLEKPKSPLLNCIHVNDLCLKIRREGVDGPSCSKVYIECVKNATSTNGNRLPTSILN